MKTDTEWYAIYKGKNARWNEMESKKFFAFVKFVRFVENEK